MLAIDVDKLEFDGEYGMIAGIVFPLILIISVLLLRKKYKS